MERNLNNIYEMVSTKMCFPTNAPAWYNTNKGYAYFDGDDFYSSGVCVNPITTEVLWWLDEIPAKNISLNPDVSGQVCPICNEGQLINSVNIKYCCGVCQHKW